MLIGISVKPTIGIGDALQFSSMPENYYRSSGEKLVDLEDSWIFDFNPYVTRDPEKKERVERKIELWNFPRKWPWPKPRHVPTYLCNAEIFACLVNVRLTLNRPRLYIHEDARYQDRKKIILQTKGRSHGELPQEIVQHVIAKYGQENVVMIGEMPSYYVPIAHVQTRSIWDLVKYISDARMFIGPDSGPSWIAACYPDIITKIVRMKPNPDEFKDWVPLEVDNVHSHWDDRCRHIHNPTKQDIGFTWSYLRI